MSSLPVPVSPWISTLAPVGAIRPVGDGDARGDVHQCEGEAAQQTQLRVRQAHIVLDRLLQDHQDLPVDEVEGVNQGEHKQAVARNTAAD